DIEVAITIDPQYQEPGLSTVDELIFKISRQQQVTMSLRANGTVITPNPSASLSGEEILIEGNHITNIVAEIRAAIQLLGQTLYVGPFRNALNAAPISSYYDIRFGSAVIAEWDSLKTGASLENWGLSRRIESDIRQVMGFDSFALDA